MNERSMIKNFEPSGFKVPIRRELLDNGSFLIITGYIRFSGVIIFDKHTTRLLFVPLQYHTDPIGYFDLYGGDSCVQDNNNR